MKEIVSISAFGFADTVFIGKAMLPSKEPLPAVVIEDQKNKLFMYGADAIYERTGLGLEDGDTSSYTKRIPVALLWQALKWSKDLNDKQTAANLIAKYVIQLICDQYQSYEQIKADAAAATAAANAAKVNAAASSAAATPATPAPAPAVPSITKSFIKANYHLVLCIPDNFDEDEQQCLINAFSGFEVSLIWRSIATLLGHFNKHIAFKAQPNTPSFADLQESSTSGRATVHVLYLGPDSIDLSTYELTLGKENSNYTLPVRLHPVYDHCATNLSFLHYALSYAHSYINTLSKPRGYEQNMELQQTFDQSLRSQVIYQFPEAWGRKLQATAPHAIRLPLNETNSDAQWGAVYGLLSTDKQRSIRFSSEEVENFYHDYELTSLATRSVRFDGQDFVSQLSKLIQNKVNEDRNHANTTLLVIGPMVANNVIATAVISDLQSTLTRYGVQTFNINWSTMALGSYIYQKRANNDQETYLDRLRKLSMVSSNADLTEYCETVLINDKEEVSPIQTHERQENLVINQGSNSIELYVSSDPNFNDETINKATTISFKEQGISVQYAKLPFRSGLEAPEAEKVSVTVQQRALSGYVRFIIKPLEPSKVLPPRGEVQVFDPAKKTDFTGTLKMPKLSYPSLYEPKLLSSSIVSTAGLKDVHTILRSDSVSQKLVCYDGKFKFKQVELNAKARLQADYNNYYDILNSYCQRLEQSTSANPQEDYQYNNLAYRYQMFYGRSGSNMDYNLAHFLSELENCLPLPVYRPFGEKKFNAIADLVASVMRSVVSYNDVIQRTTFNRLQRRYYMFVPDHPEEIMECCRLTLKFLVANTTQFTNLKLLIENHPRCFSPKSKDFCMSKELAERMYTGSLKIIDEINDEITAKVIFNEVSVKGSKKLSIALSILLYSLLWRKKEPSFLSEEADIEEAEYKLNRILKTYRDINNLLESGDYRQYSSILHTAFIGRFGNFVHNKLELQLPQVVDFLRKKGDNPNIMSAITELNEE